MTVSAQLVSAALRYAESGFAVIPLHSITEGQCTCGRADCASPGKHPRTKSGLKDATTDANQIEQWWSRWPNANLGLSTDGLLVVDDDGGDWPADPVHRLELAAAPAAKTPRGGAHFVFLAPDGKAFRNTAGMIADKIDTRADGGYIVVAPSVGILGGYKWVNELDAREHLPVAPNWLVEVQLQAQNGRNGRVETTSSEAHGRIPEGERNDTLTSLAGTARQRGCTLPELVALLRATNDERCDPSLSVHEVAGIARSVARYEPGSYRGRDTAHTALSAQSTPWPDALDDAALHGITGEFVRLVEPETEADRAALVVQFLLAFGSCVNGAPYFTAGADRHRTNVFAVLVGPTSAGRKGSSWSVVRDLMRRVDPGWTDTRVLSGMSSGEGLIWAIRDQIIQTKTFREKGKTVREDVVVDPGIKDKRLFVMESEFARVLRVTTRDGNTLSALIRLAWDSQKLQTMTKNSPAVASNPHVSIVAHITKGELLRNLEDTEKVNGFCNRFLWLCTRRSKLLPDGGRLPESDLDDIAGELREVLDTARKRGRVERDAEARELWHAEYGRLTADIPGMRGALIARGAPIVLRLSLIYALLDGCPEVCEDHLSAALAIWRYSEQSVAHIFGDATGDAVADRILSALRQAEQGISRNDIRELFQRHVGSARIGKALDLLRSAGLARCEEELTGGRPREVWHCV